jgi:hypothetical protein
MRASRGWTGGDELFLGSLFVIVIVSGHIYVIYLFIVERVLSLPFPSLPF